MQIFLNGLVMSSFYLLIATGLSLVFGVLRVVNFAHGELLMVGGYLVWFLVRLDIPFGVALLVAMVSVALLAMLIDQGLLRHIRGNIFASLMVTLGLVYVLQVTFLSIFGGLQKYVAPPLPQVLHVMGATFTLNRLLFIVAAIVLIVLLLLFLHKTKPGRAIRAITQNRDAAALQGVNLNRTALIAMVLAGALAGAAGGLMSTTMYINPYVGTTFIWIAFIIVIVGGLGSIKGTIIAAILFGFMDTIVTSLVSSKFVTIADVLAMLTFLAIRPQGLYGRA